MIAGSIHPNGDLLDETSAEGNITYILDTPATDYLPMVTQMWTTAARKAEEERTASSRGRVGLQRPMGSPPAPSAT